MSTVPRFTQLCPWEDGLFALDENGHVWCLTHDIGHPTGWYPVPHVNVEENENDF